MACSVDVNLSIVIYSLKLFVFKVLEADNIELNYRDKTNSHNKYINAELKK